MPAKIRMAARQGDVPAKIRDGGTTMGCAGLNRRWDAPAKIGNGGAAIGCAGRNRQWYAPAEIGDGGAAIGYGAPKGKWGAKKALGRREANDPSAARCLTFAPVGGAMLA